MSLQAEQSVIGCLLINENSIADVAQILSPEMFTDSFLGRVYFEILDGFKNNKVVDAVTISQRVKDSIRSEKDVSVELAELVQGQFRTESVVTYAHMVIQEYRAKKASEIINKIEFTGENIEKDIRDVTASLEALLNDNRPDEASVPEIAEEYKDDYFKDRTRPKIEIGFKDFDDAINVGGGDVMAIGARPKTGKSALALQVAIHLNDIGIKVGYFNLEMTKKQMFERMVAFTGHIDLNRVLNGTRYLDDEESRYKKAIERMKGMKNLTIFSGSKKVSDIRAESKGKGFDVIIIDYLQLLKPDGKRGANRYAEVGDISRSIKAIAMDFNIPVIILSQLNRVSEMKTDKEPTAADFRESGDIEQDVSVALLLWSPDKEDETKRMLKIELNRQGKRVRKELFFEGKYMKFYQQGQEKKEEPKKKKEEDFVKVEFNSDIPFD